MSANFLFAFSAFYENNDCTGEPYGIYLPGNLVQYAVMTTHPTGDGKVRLYVPKTNQMQNKSYLSTKSCVANWTPPSNSWILSCGCSMSADTVDLMPLEEVVRIEDLVGPLLVR